MGLVQPEERTTVEQLLARIDELAAVSEAEGSLTRRFATPALREAGELVAAWMGAAGMTTRRDAIGNVVGRLEGAVPDAPAVVLGSHLDTVPDAGRFDGALGVLAGIAVVERVVARGERLPFALEVVGFADEEGARFGTTYLGSSAFTGSFDEQVLARRDADGISLADAMRSVGDVPEAIASSARGPGELHAYLEVHIEQGPVLEDEGIPVGVVSAIAGQTRARITLVGAAGHAGTVPMGLRRDALAGAAELILAVEDVGRAAPGLVATVGQAEVDPGAGNVVPGRVSLSLDVRHPRDDARREALAEIRGRAEAVAGRRDLGVDWDVVLDVDAVATDPVLREALAGAIDELGLPVRELASGAGHDAAVIARIAPACVLFVRCLGGISHAPAESATGEDVAVAVDVVDRALRRLAEGHLAPERTLPFA